MTAAVQSNGRSNGQSNSFSAYAAQTAGGGGVSAALEDKLARCLKQLSDWEGCPSGKTPEGQKIIENLRAQINSMQSRINSAKQGAATPAAPMNPASNAVAGMGGLLNVYA